MKSLQPCPPDAHASGPVCVIIVNFNGGDLLLRALQSVAAQTRPADEVIVVDNGSTDGSLKRLARLRIPGLRVLRSSRNLGFAAAVNLAAGHSRAAWLALLNSDAEAAPDWLEQMSAATQRHRNCGLFASAQSCMARPGQLDGAGDVLSVLGLAWRGGYRHCASALPDEGRCFGACAAAAFVSRALFERLGGFEAAYFCYLEDIDFAYRAQLAGEDCIFVPTARVRHMGGATAGRHSAWTLRISARNRVILLGRNTPLVLLVVTAPLILLGLLLGLLQGALHGQCIATARGYAEALARPGGILALRRAVRPPLLPPLRLLRMMAWNPVDALTRRAVIRPLRLSRAQTALPARGRTRPVPAE